MSLQNAKNKKLSESLGPSNLPQLDEAMDGWFQDMRFIKVTKTVDNFKVTESEVILEFRGTWQNLSQRELSIKPEDQRALAWFQIHSDTNLELNLDDIIRYQGTDYRVMKRVPHGIYGYNEYHVVQDVKENSGNN